MPNKSRIKEIFMALVGVYLMYTGGALIVDVRNSQPENAFVFMITGGVFVVIGFVSIVFHIKEMIESIKKDKAETESENDLEIEDAEEIITTEELLEADAEEAEIEE